jgi:hypothetical protein
MRVIFIRPGNMALAITSQFQPVASELVAALREAAAAERGRTRRMIPNDVSGRRRSATG